MSKDKNIESIYPLSPMQSGMLFHTLYEPGSGVYFEQIVCQLQGDINATAFQDAWQKVVDRHAVLRTLFVWEKSNKPLQVVQRQVDLPWLNLDWKNLNQEEQEKTLDKFLNDDCKKGFKLNKAPLMRCALISLTDNTCYFVWSHHHILIDGWCAPIIFKEVIAFYNNICFGHNLALNRVRPYKDYITWLQKQDKNIAEDYWKEEFKDFVAPTPLLFDKSLATEKSVNDYMHESTSLSTELTLELNDLARKNRITLNSLLQIAWAILLNKYSSEKDVVFGAIVSGRPVEIEGVESMLGLFINALPVRVSLPSDRPILTLAKDLYARQVIQNQYSYTPLADIQTWAGLDAHASLFDSIMAFENYPVDKSQTQDESGIKVLDSRIVERTNYPLNILISPDSELFIKILYDVNRFERQTIQQTLLHLQTILESIVKNPMGRVQEISILSKVEKEQILNKWNDNSFEYQDDICIHTSFEKIVEKYPDKTALVFNEKKLTYRELNAHANGLAKKLQSLRVGPNVLVGILMERSLEMVVGILAVLKAGGVYVPMDPTYPKDRNAYIIDDSKSGILLTTEKYFDDFSGIDVQLIAIDKISDISKQQDTNNYDQDPGNPVSLVTSSNQAYTIYTSGSTGLPKGVVINHKNLQALLHAFEHIAPADGERIGSFVCPYTFDLSVWEIFSNLCFGGTLHILQPEIPADPQLFGDYLKQHNISCAYIPPALLDGIIDCFEDRKQELMLTRILVGVEPILQATLQRFKNLSEKIEIVNGYGPSETTICASFFLFPSKIEDPLKRTPIGKSISNYEIYILDSDLNPVPIHVNGEIYIGGAGMAMGYLNRPGLTAENFIPHPFSSKPGARLYKTGDLACYLEDGNIEFIGRKDFQIKIRGFRIELGEIESILLTHKAVKEALAIVSEDMPGIKRLVAYVVCELNESELREYLKKKLPDHMIPSAFVFLTEMPKNVNGKIDRKALPCASLSTRYQGEEYVEPTTDIETRLSEIWADVLHVEQVGIHDNFFELGGDSIISIQILSQSVKSGLKFTLKQLFQYPTIAELSSFVNSSAHVINNDEPVTGVAPLTPIQKWFFEMDMSEPYHFNQSMFFQVENDLTPTLIEKIVQQLILSHDAFRLRFTKRGDEWIQEYASVEEKLLLAQEDLSELLPHEKQPALELRAEKYQKSLNLSEGVLARFVLFDFGPDQTKRLLIIVHHLIVDGVSWRILLDDIHTAYQQLRNGQSVVLQSKTSSLKLWGEKLIEYARSKQAMSKLDYWLDDRMSILIPLPTDNSYDKDKNSSLSCDNFASSLDSENTKALLHDVPKAYNTQINDVLLTALAISLGQWTGGQAISIELEGHGREELFDDVDLSRTVGWFTAIFPAVLTIVNRNDLGETLKSIKEQLRGIPNKGLGFGLLKYLNNDDEIRSKLHALPQPEISFNYLGQFDGVFSKAPVIKSAKESAGAEISLLVKRNHLLNINSLISDGVLKMNWTYSKNIHKKETIEQLANNYMSVLESVIEHCQNPDAGGYTVSDFPGAKLEQGELESFLDEL